MKTEQSAAPGSKPTRQRKHLAAYMRRSSSKAAKRLFAGLPRAIRREVMNADVTSRHARKVTMEYDVPRPRNYTGP